MQVVSDAYREQSKQDVREVSYMEIKFGITDPDAVSNAVESVNGQMPFSENPDMTDFKEVEVRYGTFEPGIWLLDGSVLTLSEPYVYQGYVSDKMSGADCIYADAPTITVTFTAGEYAFRGLTLNFDSIQDLYPRKMTVKGYYKDNLIYEVADTVNKSLFIFDHPVPNPGEYVDKIEILFTESVLPHYRLRVEDVTLGIIKVIDADVLSDSTWSRTNDLMNTVMPDNSMDFTFYDIDREYNPDNPEGVWEYLETGQPVNFKYGLTLNDGSIYWIDGCRLYTEGTPSVKNGGSLPEVSFATTSRLQLLTDVYDEFMYSPSGITFYDLAENILQYCKVVDINDNKEYVLDESMKNYVYTGVFEPMEANQLLQLIANTCMCILGVNRNGRIVFRKRNTEHTGFTYKDTDIKTSTPDITKYPYLKNLSVDVKSYTIDSGDSEVASIDITDANQTVYTVTYSPATSLRVSASSGLTINKTNKLLTCKAEIVVTGTGTLTILGKSFTENVITVTKQCNTAGEDCHIDTAMLTDVAYAEEYLDWMAEVLQQRNVYTFDDRGFPEVDETDIIGVDTAFTVGKQVTVTGLTIKYNGALSGNVEVLG